MGRILTLKDGSNHTVFSVLDLMDLVDTYMGLEMKSAIEEEFSEAELAHYDDDEYIKDLEQENKGLRDHHKEVMEELRDASKTLAHEIGQPVQDRKAISNIAGTIGIITGRELR